MKLKKLYISITLLLGFLVSFGQSQPPKQTLGNASNEVWINGYGSAYKGFTLRNNYADTTAMNLDAYLKYIPGIQARSGDTIWQRSNDLTHWFRGGGAGSIYTDTSSTFTPYGNGSVGSPLGGTVNISEAQGNAIQSTATGLFVPHFIQDGITEPGVITWIQNYDYDVSPATGVIGGVEYTSDWTPVTLETADPTNDRIDVVVFNAGGTITVITGTPAADPQQPTVDPDTQLAMAFILVTANTTEPPSPPAQDWIYINNAEWTTLSSTARINPASTTFPYSVPLDVQGSAAQNGDNIRYTAVSPPTISNFNVITLKIRAASIWAADSRISLRWYSGATPIGSAVSIANGAYGFTSAQLSSYQIVSIPLPDFGALSSVTALLMTVTTTGGRTISFYIDDIQLQNADPVISTNDYILNQQSFSQQANAWINGSMFFGSQPTLNPTSLGGDIVVNKSSGNRIGMTIHNTNSSGVAGLFLGDGSTTPITSLILDRATGMTTLSGSTTGGLRIVGGFSGLTSLYSPSLALTIADFNGANRVSKFYGRLEGAKGADVASANSVTLGNNGNTFTITGTTQLNAIFPDHWQAGSVIHLLFSDAVLVKHNTAGDPGYARIFLAGSTDLTTDANTVLSLVYNGTQWEEMSRKLSSGAPIIGAITADNGLTANTATNVQLGGTLLQNTTIDASTFTFAMSGTPAGSFTNLFTLTSASTTGSAMYVTSAGTNPTIQAVNTKTTAGGGWALYGQSITGPPLYISRDSLSTNTVIALEAIDRRTSGTAANGIGASLDFATEMSNGTTGFVSTKLVSKLTDVTQATLVSQFEVWGMNGVVSSSIARKFAIAGTGAITADGYGVGTFAGTAAYTLQVDASGNVIEGAVGGGTYTASNGLTMTANDTKIGGTLIENSTIATGAFTLALSTSTALATPLTSTATTGNAITGTATTGIAIAGSSQGTSNATGQFQNTGGGIAGRFIGNGTTVLWTETNPASTNTVIRTVLFDRKTSGTAADGIGNSIEIGNEKSDGNTSVSTQLISKWTTATAASETSQFIITGVSSAVTADLFTLSGSGALKLNKYGVNTFAGVAAYVLAVDASGNVVEVAAAGAGMSNPLTTNGDLIYGVGSTPTRLPIGTAGQVLTVNGGGTAPEWTTVVGTGSVTSVAQSFTGGLISVSGSPITTSGTLALTVAGTSGGGVYFSGASTWASTGELTANNIMIGGGAGAAYSTTTTGTGVLTALGVNVGSAGAFVVFDGALGTPSSGVATNLTGTATALNIGGNAATATILQAARTINGTSFDGSTNITVTADANTLTNTTLNSTVVASSLTAVGTIATGVWQGTAIADAYISSAATWNAKQTGDATLTALAGLTITNGSIIYGTGADAFSVLAAGSNGQVLTLAGGVPTWSAAGTGTVTDVSGTSNRTTSTGGATPVIDISSSYVGQTSLTTLGTIGTGTWQATAVGVLYGGTGQTTYTNGQLLIGNTTGNTLTKATLTAANGISITNGTGSITVSTVFNPTVQTLTDGATITWNVTNGGNAVVTLAGTGRTLSITNPVAGYTYTVRIIQGSGGSKTITTWPTNTKWPNGTVITLSTTAGDYDVVVLYYDGTNYYATYQQDFS